jgi:hypothetical protein
MKTKSRRNFFEGMRVIADYNVGDQRIIVLERSDNAQEAVGRQQVAKRTASIARSSATALAASESGLGQKQTTKNV